VSEANQSLYRTFLSPLIRLAATEQSASAARRLHPNRMRFEMFADANPWMQPVAAWADSVRANRGPVSADNPFLAFERLASDMIASGLETWGKARDAMSEQIFLSAYGAPWLQAMMGLHADQATPGRRVERDPARDAAVAQQATDLALQMESGGLPEAAVRALLYIRLPGGMADERGLAALRAISSELPAAKRLGLARFKELVRNQYLILRLDEERAVAAIPKLLPDDRRSSEAALALIRRILESGRILPEEGSRRLKRIEALFGGIPAKTGRERQAELAAS